MQPSGFPPVGIIFHGSIPEHLRAEVALYVRAVAWLIPSWCIQFYVDWMVFTEENGDAGGAAISAKVYSRVEYAYAFMTLSSVWYAEPPYERVYTLVHEMIHVQASALYTFVQFSLKALLDIEGEGNGPRSKIVLEELRMKNEAFTQHLAMRITQQIWPTVAARLGLSINGKTETQESL